MHQIRFRLQGSAPDPAGGAYSARPDPLAGFGGRLAAGGGAGRKERREGREEKGKGRDGEVDGREKREGLEVTVEPGPLRALLRHCLRLLLMNDSLHDYDIEHVLHYFQA